MRTAWDNVFFKTLVPAVNQYLINSHFLPFLLTHLRESELSDVLFSPQYLFVWLCWVLVVACGIFFSFTCGIFSYGMQDLSCSTGALSSSMWDTVPWPGIKPRPPCIGGMWSLRHWTTREVPELNDVLKVPGGGSGLVSKSCLTLCDPEDCSPPDSCVHGISQARILEWVAISSSRASPWPRDWTQVSCTGRWILYQWATRIGLFPITV